MIPPTTEEYLAHQLSLFQGEWDHLMVEFTAHLVMGEDRIFCGIVVSHCPTNTLIAMEVPTVIGSMRNVRGMADQISGLLEFLRAHVSPF